jgi:hypothetical protein
MALDESTTEDEVFEDQGIKYLVEKTLFEKVKPVAAEMMPGGRRRSPGFFFDPLSAGNTESLIRRAGALEPQTFPNFRSVSWKT